ncbi:class I SAM-dependent methyltransferase [Pseudonocardia xinjiangensis]|uniref:class I SAM-dependent methyltransferase n=1 Tax=Pseudonocardia xinjiangensis TaxID=75289 RepID=UPI003D90D997
MPDAIFEDQRLVSIYDALDSDRRDLDVYAAMIDEIRPKAVIDLGCGTGLLARRLARSGIAVTGVDPAAGSLEYARAQPGAHRVRWILGDASVLPTAAADLVLMTGNAAQAIIEPADWEEMLRRTFAALRPGGRFVFETRDPGRRAWEKWTRAESWRRVQIDGVGSVETWVELTGVDLPLVSFRHTWVFESDGAVLTSDSTLRFRDRAEIEHDLQRHGYAVDEVRDAPDRPGLEFVFIVYPTLDL